MCKECTGYKSSQRPSQGEKAGFSEKERSHCYITCAERFHQAYFLTSLQNRCCHSRRDGQSCRQQRCQSKQQHKTRNAREHLALVLLDLADLFYADVR